MRDAVQRRPTSAPSGVHVSTLCAQPNSVQARVYASTNVVVDPAVRTARLGARPHHRLERGVDA